MKKISLFSQLLCTCFIFAFNAFAQYDEAFDYADGNLNGNGLWTGADGIQVSAASSLTLTDYVINTSDAAVRLPNGSFNGRVSANFSPDYDSDIVYLSTLIRVDSGFTTFDLTSIDMVPNAGFSASNRVGFGAINTANTGNNNSFVLFTGSNRSYSTSAFNTSTVYHVILSYEFVPGAMNDVVNLYVSPTTMSLSALPAALVTKTTTEGDPLTEFGSVSIANDNFGGDVIIDGIRATDDSNSVPVELIEFDIE